MSQEVRPAPYPADTLAKGWRFEVDMEKVKRSDTWKLAKTGPIRGALLLLWAEAWGESPCGTLPNDDQLVALTIDMPLATFTKHRAVLMRGWWLADDGRLYHETITERVLAMLDKRATDAQRAANYRARKAGATCDPDGVTGASRVTNTGLRSEFDTKHQAPDTKHQKKEEHPPKPPRKRGSGAADAATVGVVVLVSEGVTEQHAKDWLTARKAKHLPLTPTAWDDVKAEAVKANLTVAQAIHLAAIKGWAGFKAKWVEQEAAKDAASGAPSSLWWESKTGLTEKGAQLGIEVPTDEHPNAWLRFKAQVWVAAGDGPWWDKTSVAYPIAVRMREQADAVTGQVMAGLARSGA